MPLFQQMRQDSSPPSVLAKPEENSPATIKVQPKPLLGDGENGPDNERALDKEWKLGRGGQSGLHGTSLRPGAIREKFLQALVVMPKRYDAQKRPKATFAVSPRSISVSLPHSRLIRQRSFGTDVFPTAVRALRRCSGKRYPPPRRLPSKVGVRVATCVDVQAQT